MDVHLVHDLGLGSVVPDQHLHSVRHVVGDTGVLQHHVSSGGVHIETISSVTSDVSMRYCHQVWRVGDVETIVSRVLHLDVLHHRGDSPGLYCRGHIELTSPLALTCGDDLHMSKNRLGVADVQCVLRSEFLRVRSRLEPETSPVTGHCSVVNVVEGETLDAEVRVEVAHTAAHPPTSEITVINASLMSVAI